MEATYFTSVIASVAGANKRHLTIWNGAGSGKTLKLYKIVATGWPTAAVTGQVVALYSARITTQPTGGTTRTILQASNADAAAPAQVAAMAAPTNAPTEEAQIFGLGTVSGEETASAIRCPIYEFSIDGLRPIECVQGQGVIVKQGALAAAGAVTVSVLFSLV